MASRRILFLTGFAGCGKSTVGALLARRTGAGFVDIDRLIERENACTVAEFFCRRGEHSFRRMEKKMIRRTVQGASGGTVVALGGGALLDASTRRYVSANGRLVYLSCAVDELYRRLRDAADRPLLDVTPRRGETPRFARLRRIRELLEARLPGYRQAEIVLSTSRRTPTETARVLAKIIGSPDGRS